MLQQGNVGVIISKRTLRWCTSLAREGNLGVLLPPWDTLKRLFTEKHNKFVLDNLLADPIM